MTEISIHIKNSSTKMTERHIPEQEIKFSRADPHLLKLVEDAINKFRSASDLNDDDYEIIIKGKLIWQR